MIETLRRRWRGILLVVGLLLVVAAGGVVWYYGTPLPVEEAAVDAVRNSGDVTVERAHGGYVLRDPDPETERTALVFYPGGRVAPESYLATLAPLAARGDVTVFVPSMPLNLAVLDGDAAGPIIDAHPEIDRWYVGGHSLGGVFACRYAAGNPDRVDGVVLFASYCDRSIADSDTRALAVVGGRDEVLNRDAFEDNRKNLPEDARVVRIDGMNHSQFGAYSGQSGDVPGTIDDETARNRLTTVLLEWFGADSASRDRARPRSVVDPGDRLPIAAAGRN